VDSNRKLPKQRVNIIAVFWFLVRCPERFFNTIWINFLYLYMFNKEEIKYLVVLEEKKKCKKKECKKKK